MHEKMNLSHNELLVLVFEKLGGKQNPFGLHLAIKDYGHVGAYMGRFDDTATFLDFFC